MEKRYDVLLDVRNQDSPIPMIRTKETLNLLSSGDVLKVMTNRESAVKNINTMIASNAFLLMEQTKEAQDYVLYIQKP
jgi:tRNA 2-thiouridine synthesizing protein A